MTKVRIIYYQDEGGEWRWRRFVGNAKKSAVSGESFASKSNAKRAAKREAELMHPDLDVVVEEGER